MAEERITVQIVRKKVSKMEFFLNKEDRKIKKIVKKEEKIRLTKEDLKELKRQIEEYGVKEEKTVLALARLQQEDSKYLDTILKKYYKDREIPDRDIQTLCVLVKNGSFREQPAKGYEIKSEDCKDLFDVLDAINANSSDIMLDQSLGEELANLNENGKYVIFLHRPGEFMLMDNFIKKAFVEGIISNGDGLAAGGNTSSRGNIEKTFTYEKSPANLIADIKNACAAPYKADSSFNYGVFLAKIPKETLKEETPIFYERDGLLYLHPKYLDGFVNFDGNKVVSYTKNNYKENLFTPTVSDQSSVGKSIH